MTEGVSGVPGLSVVVLVSFRATLTFPRADEIAFALEGFGAPRGRRVSGGRALGRLRPLLSLPSTVVPWRSRLISSAAGSASLGGAAVESEAVGCWRSLSLFSGGMSRVSGLLSSAAGSDGLGGVAEESWGLAS
jgi:hypothetical protein